ncbi:conserved hypothetical protein [Desulforamulus reducens MI-1]|uniref:Phage tail protein n=1 Tax=Desulforamulus reducens (strain ATCC BAA-1160 / DSM 100696 / MI-1) TaxID=349161 RepID=A4J3U9_DESRM|nr:phage tail protein [Desulforamulus reducens]ABO49752.1 conserved hypothetical protein [Desulforamulus reducens MI-1]
MIGVFGDVVFEVSSRRIRTFDDFSRSITSRWEDHNIVGRKPMPEFVGPTLDTVSFSMRFDAHFGVNPRSEMDKLLIMCRSGEAETLIIGGKPLGVYKWVITDVKQSWSVVDNKGNVIIGVVDVTLKEYT